MEAYPRRPLGTGPRPSRSGAEAVAVDCRKVGLAPVVDLPHKKKKLG